MLKKLSLLFAIVIISGISGVVADRYLFPYLSTAKIFSRWSLLKKSTENITFINKTEQVYLKEESSFAKVSGQIASSLATIVSVPNAEIKTGFPKGLASRSGTGMIVTSDGLVMTYLSAINSDNCRYKVILSDQNVYDAEIFGIDSYSNLVFLKINASNLSVASFGNSDDIKPGEKIIAVGKSAENNAERFSSGVLAQFNPTFNLSGKTLSSSEKLEGVFISDFINNSAFAGGPIVDYSGQIMGVTGSMEKDGTMVFFQIPANKIKNIIDRAINRNLENNYNLGIYYVPLTKNYALAHNLKQEKGALVYSPSGQQGLAIISGSNASKAGIRINDLITRVDGEEVGLEKNLPDLLYKYKKGNEIELTLLRDGSETKIKVSL